MQWVLKTECTVPPTKNKLLTVCCWKKCLKKTVKQVFTPQGLTRNCSINRMFMVSTMKESQQVEFNTATRILQTIWMSKVTEMKISVNQGQFSIPEEVHMDKIVLQDYLMLNLGHAQKKYSEILLTKDQGDRTLCQEQATEGIIHLLFLWT